MMRAVRMREVAAAMTLIGLLAGCSGGGGGSAATDVPSSPSSIAPTTTAPVTTATAKPKPTKAAAIGLAQRLLTAINTLYQTQDGTAVKQICDSGQCPYFVDRITTAKRQGYHFSGGRIARRGKVWAGYGRVVGAKHIEGTVKIPVRVADLHVTDPQGQPYNSYEDPAGGQPGYDGTFECDLEWINGRWIIGDFSFG